MKIRTRPRIVIIDDNIKGADDEPLVAELQDEYGEENISIFQRPKDGLNYLEDNLSNRMIVLLDIMFGHNKPEGFKVFESISQKTSLVCFILMTGNIESVDRNDLVNLVNRHAWYFIQRDESSEKILSIIKDAERYISTRVDGALEEWILKHSPDDRDKPYLRLRNGQKYSLNNILDEIRRGTEFGQEMTYSILNLAIDLLARDKAQLNNA